MEIETTKHIILFDGVCNLCNASVNFIIKRDKKDHFRFAPLQSQFAQELCKKYDIDILKMESVLLIEKQKLYTQSTAALRISKKLSGLWPVLYTFIIIPTIIRNPLYNLIARNRYKWFGKKDTCMIPRPELKEKFIS